nr:unnamed protein product [Spirometra erinaceieuropaei]
MLFYYTNGTLIRLPSKTDLEKKIELAKFFSRTRNLFIRLEALVKWANSASKVDKCEKISNFLDEQSFFLLSTANSLSSLLRDNLVEASALSRKSSHLNLSPTEK